MFKKLNLILIAFSIICTAMTTGCTPKTDKEILIKQFESKNVSVGSVDFEDGVVRVTYDNANLNDIERLKLSEDVQNAIFYSSVFDNMKEIYINDKPVIFNGGKKDIPTKEPSGEGIDDYISELVNENGYELSSYFIEKWKYGGKMIKAQIIVEKDDNVINVLEDLNESISRRAALGGTVYYSEIEVCLNSSDNLKCFIVNNYQRSTVSAWISPDMPIEQMGPPSSET